MSLHRNVLNLRQFAFSGKVSPLKTFNQRFFSVQTVTSPVSDKILFDHHSGNSGAVSEIRLNAPKALNAVDTNMCNAMIEELKRWERENCAPRVLLMSGEGGKAFCAGGDVVSLYKAHVDENADKSILKDFFAREYLLDFSLSQLSKTRQISIWNGIVMGGGVGLTWHSPVRIATDNSMYAMPETAIGFFTDVGGSHFLSRMRNDEISLGLYLGLTGARVKSKDLVRWGIATHFVD